MKNSKKFRLGKKDFFKGLLIAVGAPVVAIVQTSIVAGVITINWPIVGTTALAAGLAYLSKNFFEGEKWEIGFFMVF